MDRRRLLLQEMGLTQWQLRRADALRGVTGLQVAESVRLIILTHDDLAADPLLADILRSLDLKREACLIADFARLPHMNIGHELDYWLLDEREKSATAENGGKTDRTFIGTVADPAEQSSISTPISPSISVGELPHARRIYRSPNWATFKQSPSAKRTFWQQIQQPD